MFAGYGRDVGGTGGLSGTDPSVVPRVIGLTLVRARTRIRRAHCSVGRIRRAHSRRVGRVISQSPRPGTVKPRGFRVKLVVGRR